MYFDALGSDSLEHTVMVFDSLPSNRFTFRTKEQIASICCCKGKKVVAVIKNVQNQQGASDCGLLASFSLAFATSLCFGDNPSEIQYNQKQLREHVVSCFEAKVITPFPAKSRRRCNRARAEKEYAIPVYCSCRLPESGRMVQCVICHEWYHEECESISSEVWINKKYKWTCTTCLKASINSNVV